MINKMLKKFVSKIKSMNSVQVSTSLYKHGLNFRCNSHIDSLNPQFIEIGDNFISAPGSIITAHDASCFIHTKKYRVERVKIGNNVFLGANSVVLPGVVIGDNVIIGAGAIVNRSLSSNSVYAGNPAKYICSLDEYLKRCEERNVLYSVPKAFIDQYNAGMMFAGDSIKQYQDYCIEQESVRDKSSSV